MIKGVFLPEQIQGFFLRSMVKAGIFIGTHTVQVALIRASRSQRFIETLFELPIISDPQLTPHDATVATLKQALLQIPTSAQLIGMIPSSMVIYKIIQVPIMPLEKIKLIMPFEIEGHIPFPLSAAAIDCIIIDEEITEQCVHVLVTIIHHTVLEQYRAYFADAGRTLDRISTDLVELICLLHKRRELPEKSEEKGRAALLCINADYTLITVSVAGRLRGVRVINQGTRELFVLDATYAARIATYIRDITVTVATLSQAFEKESGAVHYTLCGEGVEKRELCELLKSGTDNSCELLTINKILHSGTIVTHISLHNSYLSCIAGALPSELSQDYNLDRIQAERTAQQGYIKQYGTTLVLLLLIFLVPLTTYIVTVYSIKSRIRQEEKSIITKLLAHIPIKKLSTSNATVAYVNKQALGTIIKEESAWFALSNQRRFHILHVLQALSKHINRDDMGLNLDKLTFTDNEKTGNEKTGILTLEGSVKTYPDLRRLEAELRKLPHVESVSNLPDTTFVATVVLKNSFEEQI